MIYIDDELGAEKIEADYKKSKMYASLENEINWIAYKEFLRVVLNKDGQLSKLEEQADAHPNNSDVQSYLAECYEYYHKNKEAADTFEKASQIVENTLEKLQLSRQSVSNYIKSSDLKAATDVISRMKSLAYNTKNGEHDVLIAQRSFAEAINNDEVLLAIMERLVDINPSDDDLRFSLAYKHSEQGNNSLALFHYNRIPFRKRSSVTWNNLGVACDRLELPVKSVEAYRKAEDMGETLAMSNLAWKFISTGFSMEAKKLCEMALTIKDYHKNIGTIITRLQDILEEEKIKETEFLKDGRTVSEFYRDFGKALGKPDPTNLATHWQGPECKLTVCMQDGRIIAEGCYECKSVGLLALALLPTGFDSANKTQPPGLFHIKFEGQFMGYAVEATLTRQQEKDQQNIGRGMPSLENKIKTLLVLNEDASVIQVMEIVKGGKPKFYSLNVENE